MSEPDRPPSALRHPEILVAPGITFLAVIAMLVVARVYDRLPVRAPECGFRERFSVPCAGCGGTRSMQALSKGKLASALRFHPAAVLGVFASFIWLFRGLQRYRRDAMPTPPEKMNRLFLRGVTIAFAIVLANWVYLIFFLP